MGRPSFSLRDTIPRDIERIPCRRSGPICSGIVSIQTVTVIAIVTPSDSLKISVLVQGQYSSRGWAIIPCLRIELNPRCGREVHSCRNTRAPSLRQHLHGLWSKEESPATWSAGSCQSTPSQTRDCLLPCSEDFCVMSRMSLTLPSYPFRS
jgi:hypothetical protein